MSRPSNTTLTCPICSKTREEYVRPSRPVIGYCSKKCQGLGHTKPKENTNCLKCNNSLNPNQKKFCSRSCSISVANQGFNRHKSESSKPDHKCLMCPNMINHARKYCSRKCSSKSQIKYHTPEDKLHAVRRQNRESTARYLNKRKYQTPVGADLEAIKEFYLGCPRGYEVDHIVPVSRGGIHDISNFQYLTISDNKSKGNKLMSEWIR